VGQCWLAEVSCLEQPGDLLQMFPHGSEAGLIGRLLDGHLDSAAVFVEQEMMDAALLIEAHRLGAALQHLAVMRVVIMRLPRRWLLGQCR
jgi:hypothetical protein